MTDAAAPGFFGKVPARGDFLARRVPPAFAQGWEAWLAGLTTAARGRAPAEDWPDAWLTAPLWHFALGSAIVPPGGAAGVLVASADKVGRLFPFTVLGAAGGGTLSLPDWSRAVESLVLGALEDGFDPDTLDQALTELGPPPSQAGPDGAEGVRPLPAEEAETWASHGEPPGPRQSIWWCRGSDHVAPVRLCCAGLPDAATAAAMVLGGDAVTPSADHQATDPFGDPLAGDGWP